MKRASDIPGNYNTRSRSYSSKTERARQVAWQTRKDSFSNMGVRLPIWRNILSSKCTGFKKPKEKVIVV